MTNGIQDAQGEVKSAQGEDRSSFQAVTAWTDNDFGFVKATEATGWHDPTFAANWAALKQEGKPRGAYHFFHPYLNPEAQASFFMSVVKAQGLEPGDMLVVDSEIYTTADGLFTLNSDNGMAQSNVPIPPDTVGAPDMVGSGTLRFLQTVQSLAQPPQAAGGAAAAATAASRQNPLIVYTNLSVGSLLASCTGFELWIAYPVSPPDYSAPQSVAPWHEWRFWQWGFGGGPGGGDRDAYNGTQQELVAWINSFKQPPAG